MKFGEQMVAIFAVQNWIAIFNKPYFVLFLKQTVQFIILGFKFFLNR